MTASNRRKNYIGDIRAEYGAGNRTRKIKLIEEMNQKCLPDCVISTRMTRSDGQAGEDLYETLNVQGA